MNIHNEIRMHPAFSKQRIGTRGFSVPKLEGTETVPIQPDTIGYLATKGISIKGDPGENNQVVIYKDMEYATAEITFHGRTKNNLFYLAFPAGSHGRLKFWSAVHGDNNVSILMPGWPNVSVDFYDSNNGFYCGAGASMDFLKCVIREGTSIQIGDDCMFAWNIFMRTSDLHSIFSLESHEILNRSESIVIGPHVWLAHNLLVFKGVEIGAGSVVGAGSSVSRSVPPHSVAVGVPAKVIRSGVSWSRNFNPTPSQIEQALSLIRGDSA